MQKKHNTNIHKASKVNYYFILFLVILLLIPYMGISDSILNVLVLALLFGSLSISWDWVGGYTGQLSLGHSIFFGIGAYSSVLLSMHYDLTPWLIMPIAASISALVALILFYPIFKASLSGPYFALTTMGLAVIFETIAANSEFVNGNNGVMLPFKDTGLYWLQSFDQGIFYYSLAILLIILIAISYWIKNSSFGYQLAAIRSDLNAAKSCGINVYGTQAAVTMASAFFTAIGGVFYAQIVTHVDPKVFSVEIAVMIMLPAIVGGQRWLLGPFFGALILELINHILRTTVGADIPALNLMFYGLLMICIVLFLPSGILPSLMKPSKK